MTWQWGPHPDVEPRLEACYQDYPGFRSRMRRCMEAMARSARHGIAIDEDVGVDPNVNHVVTDRLSSWLYSATETLKGPFGTALGRILHTMLNRDPPLELWSGQIEMFDVSSSFDCTIDTLFEVDRTGKKVTFLEFFDLPGADG